MALKLSHLLLLGLLSIPNVFAGPLEWFAIKPGRLDRVWPLPPTERPSVKPINHSWLPRGLSPKLTMEAIHAQYAFNTVASLPLNGSCTAKNMQVRREWGNLTPRERLNYISALQCLARLPSKTSPDLAPGARNRYDDFVVAHITNTRKIHWTGLFFPWHREFVWQMEQALRTECGYTGAHPYWDWSKWADLQPSANPLFSGNGTSISGNGMSVIHGASNITTPGGDPPLMLTRPPGSGGGCVDSGPLVNWTINLGPVTIMDGTAGRNNPRPDGLGYNPRCIIRDFEQSIIASTNNYQNVTDVILNSSSIREFHPGIEFGVHGGGHFFIGGLNSDLFASPGDPAFFMHHAMVDRVWSLWQGLDLKTRTFVDGLDQTHTLLNAPPSPNITLDDQIYFTPVFPNGTVRDVMSPTMGKYCYTYD